MRHASISTTMTYYANVDDAAMEAVRGKRETGIRVAGRVTEPEAPRSPEKADGANLDAATDSGAK